MTAVQNTTGGFGGGYGQYSHLAPTYAAVLSAVVVGGDKVLELIDRKAMFDITQTVPYGISTHIIAGGIGSEV